MSHGTGPCRVLDGGAQPLHGVEASRALEAAAATQLPSGTLMARAGLSIARLTLALAPHARRVWIAAGPGNNGGDGFAAAAHLQAWGRDVTVTFEPGKHTMPPDADAARARAQAAGVRFSPQAEPPPGTTWAIDALFGLGLRRPVEGWAAAAIRSLNALTPQLLAVDLPSGLATESGQPLGEAVVRARWTLALLSLKPGLVTGAGRDLAGELWFDDLAVDRGGQPPMASLLTAAAAAALRPPARAHASHKGSYGDVWVVGGAAGMVGASLLAARAAVAAGAGRVFWLPLDAQAPALDPGQPEVMRRGAEALRAAASALPRATVVAGCGGGDAVRDLLPLLISRAGRLLLDADALNAIANEPALAARLAARSARGAPTVLTPHPLEAGRLLGLSAAQVQADRLGAAQALAAQTGAHVVLKGSGTLIAAPHGAVPLINASGNAALASGGTGDVLAGWIGGLWSQARAGSGHATTLAGMPRASNNDAEASTAEEGLATRACAWGVATHGAAADRWLAQGHTGVLPASALIEVLKTVC